MKKVAFILLSIALLFATVCTCYGQLEVSVKLNGLSCDSVRLRSFNWQKKAGTNLVMPYSETVTFKQKSALKSGAYWITADSTPVATVILSAKKKQNVSMMVSPAGVTFSNSPENTRYEQYLTQIKEYEQQMAGLDQEFRDAQNLPAYMLRTLADSLTARARRIVAARTAFEQKVILDNPNTLLESIVAASIPTPEVPVEYYNNPRKMQEFFISHFFDNFPWNDPRIFNTPVAEEKFKSYVDFVYQVDRPDLDTFVVEALKASSIDTASHRMFFERLDKDLGYYMSNYKVEHTYIKMLQYVLSTKDLAEYRRVFYEHELATINKNLRGSIVPDFRIVTDKGDTTTLYQVQAEYMLLFLHNPSCSTCRKVRSIITKDEVLNKAINSGRLKVLTVYLENDEQLWDTYLRTEAFPQYIHGWNFDQAIEKEALYETRTIPYMFFLDKDKRVIQKNILYDEIDNYIYNYLQIH